MLAFSSTQMVYTASCDFFYTSCRTISVQITLQVSQVNSHTHFLFEYMNALKLIHEEKYFVM